MPADLDSTAALSDWSKGASVTADDTWTHYSCKLITALADLPDGASRALEGEDDPFEGDYLHAIRITRPSRP